MMFATRNLLQSNRGLIGQWHHFAILVATAVEFFIGRVAKVRAGRPDGTIGKREFTGRDKILTRFTIAELTKFGRTGRVE